MDKSGKSWIASSSSGYSGDGAMVTSPNTGLNIDVDYAVNSPRMDYQVNFVHTGIHYIWARGLGSGTNNSFHAGLDGTEYSTCDRINDFSESWTWSNSTMDGPSATLNVTSAGLHTVNVWMREDGCVIDKIVITTDANYTPDGNGPAESPRVGDNNPPTAVIGAYPTEGAVPLTVAFDAGNSTDPDGDVLSYSWDFGDGSSGSSATASHTYTIVGIITATLTVDDGNGGSDTQTVLINTTTNEEVSPLDMKLSSFALYGAQSVTIGARTVFSGGGAVGSDGPISIKYDAVINDDLFSGNNVLMETRAQINGNVTLTGTLTKASDANVNGTVTEGAQVDVPSLSEHVITPGANAILVDEDDTLQLVPGVYGNVRVESDAVLILTAGNYVFNSLFIDDRADVILDVAIQDVITINVAGNFELFNRGEIYFKNFAYASSCRINTKESL